MSNRIRTYLIELSYHLCMAFIAVFPALYNRYPLVYFDTSAYLEMAANFEPSFHRAMGYPLLIRITGLMISNWPLVIIQGLVLSWLIFILIGNFFNSVGLRLKHFLAMVLLAFGSSMSWYAAQLMPDVWTLIMILAVAALLTTPKPSFFRLTAFGILIFFALLSHLSHISILILLLIILTILYFLPFAKELRLMLTKTKLLLLLGVLLLSFATVTIFNGIHGLGYKLSLSTNVFVTGNLCEMGILKMYLDENCPNAPANLCAIKDNLPKETGGFLWDGNGPVQSSNASWGEINKAYSPIVKDFISQPRYLKWLLFSSVKATFKQMFQIELGSGLQYAYGEGSPPYWPMKAHFKQELNEYLTSVQNKGDALPLSFFRSVNYLTILLSLIIIIHSWYNDLIPSKMKYLIVFFALAYFFNAAVTGILANVYERLQCRLLPLLQFCSVLTLFYNPAVDRFLNLRK